MFELFLIAAAFAVVCMVADLIETLVMKIAG